MKITEIYIKNYRQYKDTEYIFRDTKDLGIYSFIGQNGMGKTNLLNAITWCLYEKENYLGDKNKALPITNLSACKELNPKDKLEVLVKIKVVDSQFGNDYIFERKSMYVMDNQNKPFKSDSKFQTYWKESTKKIFEVYDGEAAQNVLRKCFPENVSEYFFFDGEQLHQYFNHQNAERIKSTILEINQINHLENMAVRLEQFKKANNKSITNIDIQKVNDEIEKLEESIKNDIKVKDEIERQIEENKQNITSISESLKGIEDVSNIEKKREGYKMKIEQLNAEELELKKNLREFILQYGKLIYFFPQIKELINVIKEKESKNMLPPKIDKSLLEKVLVETECPICYSHVTEENVLKIKEILNKIEVSSNVSHKLVQYKPVLEMFIKELKKFKKRHEDFNSKRSKIFRERNEILGEIDAIDKKLSIIDNKDKVKEKQNNRAILEKLKDDNIGKVSILKHNIEKAKNELELKTKEFNRLLEKEEQFKKIQTTNEFIEKSIKILNKSKAELIDEIRKEIENTTQKLFFDLIWKKNTFKNVEVTKDFNIKLYHLDGFECLGSASAAERAALALSFTLALHKIANLKTPLVIDTPLSRVSDENRVNFAKIIESLSKDKQVILLFTPAEYSDDIQGILDPINSAKVLLNTKQENETFMREI